MKGVLQDIIKWCLQLNRCLKIPGPFHVSIVGQSSSKTMSHNCHVWPKLNLGIVLLFVVWHMVTRLVMSGWTWSMLLEHLNVISLPNCGFDWPLVEGLNGVLRVNEIDHDVPFQQSGWSHQSSTLLSIEMTFGFGSSGHFNALLLIKPCRRYKSMCSH